MEVIMEVIRLGKRQVVIPMTLAGCLLLFFASLVTAENINSAVSVDETLLIQGVVRRVLPEENMILVKVSQGEKIKIRVSQQTGFVDIISLEELEKGQRVKVWYIPLGEENRAVKIERLPELGC